MNDAQIQTFATDIQNNTDPVVVAALASGANNVILDWYNGTASPDFWVFKDMISLDEFQDAVDFDEYSIFKSEMLAIIWITQEGAFKASSPIKRAHMAELFTGANTTKSQILAAITRKATNIQKLFAEATTGPGGGNGSSASSSAIATIESASLNDVRQAVSLIS